MEAEEGNGDGEGRVAAWGAPVKSQKPAPAQVSTYSLRRRRSTRPAAKESRERERGARWSHLLQQQSSGQNGAQRSGQVAMSAAAAARKERERERERDGAGTHSYASASASPSDGGDVSQRETDASTVCQRCIMYCHCLLRRLIRQQQTGFSTGGAGMVGDDRYPRPGFLNHRMNVEQERTIVWPTPQLVESNGECEVPTDACPRGMFDMVVE